MTTSSVLAVLTHAVLPIVVVVGIVFVLWIYILGRADE